MTTPGSLPAPKDKQFLHITSRRRGAVSARAGWSGSSTVGQATRHRRRSRPLPHPGRKGCRAAPPQLRLRLRIPLLPRFLPHRSAISCLAGSCGCRHSSQPNRSPRLRSVSVCVSPGRTGRRSVGVDYAWLCRSLCGGRDQCELHPLRLSRLTGAGKARLADLPAVPLAGPFGGNHPEGHRAVALRSLSITP